jgi:hypothetical protein
MWTITAITVISVSHRSSPPLIPDVKCIAWTFDGSGFVSWDDEDGELRKLRFENGDAVPNVQTYFDKY